MSYTWAALADENLKRKFAIELARDPANPFRITSNIFTPDMSLALQAATVWVKDPVVIEILATADRHKDDMPTKLDIVRKAMAIVDEVAPNGYAINKANDRIAAIRLVADVLGYIPKESTNVNVNVDTKVLVAPAFKTEADFEAVAIKQQRNLIANAARS